VEVAEGPELAAARAFLAGLVAQDFTAVTGALAADVRVRALLPGGLWERTGADAVATRFAAWFGDTEQFDVLEATVGEVGPRLQLRWRFRLRAPRLGPGGFVVEQVAYADVDGHARISRLDLLCTGYLREASDG
jgi:hypothetical protein